MTDLLAEALDRAWLSFHARTSEHDNQVIRMTFDAVRNAFRERGVHLVTVESLVKALDDCTTTDEGRRGAAAYSDEAAAILAALGDEA